MRRNLSGQSSVHPPFHQSRGFIVMLGALIALGPMSTDIYLPALPDVARDLGQTIHDVEISISLFLAGISIGQLLGGPLSDHFGRLKGIYCGLFLFCFGSCAIVFTPDVGWLWCFRAVQGLGAGITTVNAPAIIRDLYSGRESAQALSRAAIIMMVTPILSPTAGLMISRLTGWRSIFFLLTLYGLVLALVIFLKLPETRAPTTQTISTVRRYGLVLLNPRALVYLLSMGCIYGIMFAYITASPWLYIEYFALNDVLYPMIFGGIVIALMLMNRINIRLLRTHDAARLITVGKIGQLLMSTLLLGYVVWAAQADVIVLTLLMMLVLCFHAPMVANSMACINDMFPSNSGTATALMGSFGFISGSVASSMIGLFADGTPRPMALIIFLCAAFSVLISGASYWARK